MGKSFTIRDQRILGNIISVVMSLILVIIFIKRQSEIYSERMLQPIHHTLTPLAQDIVTFERSHTTLSLYLLGGTLLFSMLYLFAFTTRRTIYPQGIYLQPLIYIAVALSIGSMSINPLLTAIALLLTLCAAAEIYSVNHTSYATSIYSDTPTSFKSPTSRLVVGALYMGILALIFPPMLILVLTLPIIVFCFDRYIYELLIPMVSFFVPMGAELYVRWLLYDANIGVLLSRYWSLFNAGGSAITSWSNFTALLQQSYPTTFLIIFSLILSGLGLARIINSSITARARQRFVYSVVLFAVGLIMTMLSSFTPNVLLIVAAPVAILITAALINLRLWVSILVFILYILLAIFAIV